MGVNTYATTTSTGFLFVCFLILGIRLMMYNPSYISQVYFFPQALLKHPPVCSFMLDKNPLIFLLFPLQKWVRPLTHCVLAPWAWAHVTVPSSPCSMFPTTDRTSTSRAALPRSVPTPSSPSSLLRHCPLHRSPAPRSSRPKPRRLLARRRSPRRRRNREKEGVLGRLRFCFWCQVR